MNEVQDYYMPSGQEGFDDGMVLKPINFKPLVNVKTGNFFSYAFAIAERGTSVNSENNIRWVSKAPPDIQDKIDQVKRIHENIVEMMRNLKRISKKGTQYDKELMQERIDSEFIKIDEVIYPQSERVKVESSEAKRFRLEQQKELTLDSETINALRGDGVRPVPVKPPPGSTSDANVAAIKLELANQRIAEMEAQDNTALEEAQNEIKRLKANAKRRKPRSVPEDTPTVL